jgi:hypothetical protein
MTFGAGIIAVGLCFTATAMMLSIVGIAVKRANEKEL